jgi:hypothetical protein
MSEVTTPKIVQLFEYKKEDSEQRMARTFAAFVRVGGRKKTAGYIVFSSDFPMKAFRHENFVAFWVAPEREGGQVVTSIIDSVRQANREIYLDENFHDSMVVDAVGGCARRIISDGRIPRALAFGMITIDSSAHLTATVGSGESLAGESVAGRAAKIFLVGCTDLVKQRAVKAAITKRLIKGSGSNLSQKKLAKEIKKITGLKMTGCMVVADD